MYLLTCSQIYPRARVEEPIQQVTLNIYLCIFTDFKWGKLREKMRALVRRNVKGKLKKVNSLGDDWKWKLFKIDYLQSTHRMHPPCKEKYCRMWRDAWVVNDPSQGGHKMLLFQKVDDLPQWSEEMKAQGLTKKMQVNNYSSKKKNWRADQQPCFT